MPWAAVILEADTPFAGNTLLDLYVKGAGE